MKSPLQTVKDRLVLVKTLYGFVDLVKHPEHLARVFEISDALVQQRMEVLGQMRDGFARSPAGARALRDKHRLSLDLRALDQLPRGTLGRTFADHMRENGLDPAAIPVLEGDDELLFVRAHLYETHDIWHAVTGFHTDVAGELGLQAFYAAQFPSGLPLVLLAMGFLNTVLYSMADRERRLDAIARGWEMGRRAQPLFGVRWDELWARDVAEVRRSLDLVPYDGTRLAAAA